MYSFKQLIKRLLHYVKNYRLTLFLSLLTSIIYVFTTLYAPYIIGQKIINLFDKGFVIEKLYEPFIQLGITVAIGFISGILMGRLLNITTYKIVKDLQIDAFNKLLNLPISYLDKKSHGEILTRITTDVDKTWDGLLHGFTHLFRGIVAIIMTIVFMFYTKWDLALVVILLTPLSLIIATLIAKKSHYYYSKQAKITGEMGSLVNEMISEQKTVISYNLGEENINKYSELNKQLYKVGVKAQFVASFANPGTRFANAIVYAVVALYGAILIVHQPTIMNVGVLSIFLFYASQYTRPFNEISGVFAELSSSLASLRRVLELIDEKDMESEVDKKDIVLKKYQYDIKNISFSYEENKKILKNISFKILENKKIALVGPTGCGKTTFINLLMKYYDLDSGNIILDKTNINEIKKSCIRKNVGMVLQDTWLFKGSVKDNIRYGNEKATNDEIETAARAANAHDFISKLPNGYDTIIDDDEGISIGQKQLICIARLMLVLPKIIILDEATSNIDTRTEVKVQKAFNLLMEGRTSIVIAHRLSTIRNSDLIIVMKDGKVIEKGNHKQLLKLNGFYKELYYSN